MKSVLLTVAEIAQAFGVILPPDPERTAATAELLLEAEFQTLDLRRLQGAVESGAAEVHIYSVFNEVQAEAAFAAETSHSQRTKMILARALQRHGATEDGETLHSLWSTPFAILEARAAPFLPTPPAPAEPPGKGRGRGRARGRGKGLGKGRGRLAGRGRLGP